MTHPTHACILVLATQQTDPFPRFPRFSSSILNLRSFERSKLTAPQMIRLTTRWYHPPGEYEESSHCRLAPRSFRQLFSILLTRPHPDFGPNLRIRRSRLWTLGRSELVSKRFTYVLPTHEVLDYLAGRIEQAYALRRAHWFRGCSTSRVWYTAALRLWEAHASDSALVPLDPELFVASQPISSPLSAPWTEVAHPESARRYRSAVRGSFGN